MKMNKTQLKLKIALLENALGQIQRKEERFICCAINWADSYQFHWNFKERLKKRIERAIYPHDTIENWLAARRYKNNVAQARAVRIRWLKASIAEAKRQLKHM